MHANLISLSIPSNKQGLSHWEEAKVGILRCRGQRSHSKCLAREVPEPKGDGPAFKSVGRKERNASAVLLLRAVKVRGRGSVFVSYFCC